MYFESCHKVTIKNMLNCTGETKFYTCNNISLTNILVKNAALDSYHPSKFMYFERSSNIFISQVYDVCESGFVTYALFDMSGCYDIKIRNIGMMDYPINMRGITDSNPLVTNDLSARVQIARCFFRNADRDGSDLSSAATTDIVYQDCQMSDNR